MPSFFHKGPAKDYGTVKRYENGSIQVRKGRILSCRVEAPSKIKPDSDWEWDVGVKCKIVFGSGEGAYEREQTIGSWFKREKTAHGYGPVTGMGRMFKVSNFFLAGGLNLDDIATQLGVDEQLASGMSVDAILKVYDAAAEQIVDAEILFLEYVKGYGKESKLAYSTWDTYGNPLEDEIEAADHLVDLFFKELESGWGPKNYRPDIQPPSRGEINEDSGTALAKETFTETYTPDDTVPF